MDITKCANTDCKIKDNCLRHLAKDNDYQQSYAHFECNVENKWQYKLRVNKIDRRAK